LQDFLTEGVNWPLMDMLEVLQNLDSFKHLPIIVRVKVLGNPVNTKETYTEQESYYEDVVITPGGFFKKAVIEKQKKTRMVTKTRTVTKNAHGSETVFEFFPIPAGTFSVESTEVKIDHDFYLGKYPVTQQQFEAVMGDNPSHFKGGSLPVETVSWDDAQTFIQKLNTHSGKKLYRLPTEAEWEYAFRAGSTSLYYFGDDESQLGEYAWYLGNSVQTTHPVGQKKPNGWGLYDMAGNVWEWTDSWYDSSRSNRVLRGGSWFNTAVYCRSAYRFSFHPDYRLNYVGFRLVFVP
jgi:formylglycine-generating enzyme required for sulfatase activity